RPAVDSDRPLELTATKPRSDTPPSVTSIVRCAAAEGDHDMQTARVETGVEPDGAAPRRDWTLAQVEALFALPLNDLLFEAQGIHRRHFDPNAVQMSTLLSIKTGACPEDCAYCPQSIRFDTGVETH